MGFDRARPAEGLPASSAPAWRVALLTALAYFALGQLGLLLAIPPGGVTLVWPPAGVALAAAIRVGRPGLVGVALGAFALAVPLFADSSAGATIFLTVAAAAMFAAGTTLQAALARALVRRAAGYPYSPATPLSLTAFFFFGGVVPGFAGAALDNLTLFAFGRETGAELIGGLTYFWMGDVAGAVVFGAALLAFDGPTAGACLKRAAPVVSVAAAGLAATIALVRIDAASIQRDIDSEFALLSRESATRLEATVDLGQHAIEGLAGGFALSRPHELTDFRAIADKLAAFGLGIQALEWIPAIPDDERASFEAEMSRQWGKPFRIFERRDGKPVEVSPRPAYFPVAFVTPLEGNEGVVGFDLSSNPAREAALIKARDSGASVATAGVKLVQNNQMGILLFSAGLRGRRADGDRRTTARGAERICARRVFRARPARVALRTSDMSLFHYLADRRNRLGRADRYSPPTALASGTTNFMRLSACSPRRPRSTCNRACASPTATGPFSSRRPPPIVAKHSDSSPYWLLIGGMVLTALSRRQRHRDRRSATSARRLARARPREPEIRARSTRHRQHHRRARRHHLRQRSLLPDLRLFARASDRRQPQYRQFRRARIRPSINISGRRSRRPGLAWRDLQSQRRRAISIGSTRPSCR